MKEDNKLIAEYMGVAEYMENNIYQYDIDWNRLIPVVQKIEQECEGVPQELLRVSIYSDIWDVHQAVVKFIKNPYEKNPNVEWIFHQQGTEGVVGVLKTDNEND